MPVSKLNVFYRLIVPVYFKKSCMHTITQNIFFQQDQESLAMNR